MLLRFTFENFKSFKNETSLNLMPAKRQQHSDHVITQQAGIKTSSLPVAAIYGANASGKSNLIDAIYFAQELIIEGTKADQRINIIPFKLNSGTNINSKFEFEFINENVLYTYGFILNQKQIEEEWLFGYYNNRESKIFERITSGGKTLIKTGNIKAINKSSSPTERKKNYINFLAESTRPNQLFLTEARERNVDFLKPVIHWFQNHLKVIYPDSKFISLVSQAYKQKEFLNFLSQYLKLFDIGIESLELSEKDVDSEKMPKDLYQKIIQKLDNAEKTIEGADTAIKNKDGNLIEISINSIHKTSDGKDVIFEIEEESDGTIRMLHLIPIVSELLGKENVYIIDELDRSLHPLLSKNFINIFLSFITDKQLTGQIIFSTHQTHLLDLENLRRDEIWFVEKSKEGCSHLTSLAEYKVRKDLRIEKGYLNGRFGAIPFIGDPKSLLK